MSYIHNGSLRNGRRHFFSETLHRWSFLAQHPTMTTYREAVCLAYFIYCVYQTYVTLGALRFLLWHQQVEDVCALAPSGMACLQAYVWQVLGELFTLLGRGLTWLPVTLVAIFFGEEAIMRWEGGAASK